MYEAVDILGETAAELMQVYVNFPEKKHFGECKKRLNEIDRITREAMVKNPSAFQPKAIEIMFKKTGRTTD